MPSTGETLDTLPKLLGVTELQRKRDNDGVGGKKNALCGQTSLSFLLACAESRET